MQDLQIKPLIEDGILPADASVLSTHNNLVVASVNHGLVFRIARVTSIERRADPGDLRYAHRLAWILGESTQVLRPVQQAPLQYGDIVISAYPLCLPVNWSKQQTQGIVRAVATLGEASGLVAEQVTLRRMDISEYAGARLEYAREQETSQPLVSWAMQLLQYYRLRHSFAGLVEADAALIHGDLHADNAVEGADSMMLFIDLDSVATGPRLYDLASWYVRRAQGDKAPIDDVAAHAEYIVNWNEEVFRVLVGWKLVSSVSHMLRYGQPSEMTQRLRALDAWGVALSAPGPWGLLGT